MARRSGSNLADIAKATGVTTATVSRVLNNRYEGFSVRPELRERILKAAVDLHYRPDLMAQSLRKADMGIIGLLGTHLPFQLSETTLRTMVEIFEDRHMKVSTYFARTLAASHDLPPWRIDGAVLIGALSADDTQHVERAGIPYVSINGWCGPAGASVQFDDVGGTRQVMEHLIALGHRRIAYANAFGPYTPHPSVALRHQTYLACLREHGLKPVIMHDEPLTEPAAKFVKCVVEQGKATAVLAYQHFHAVEILQAALDLGISVPGQLSLACFNDEYPIQYLHPRFTAVALPTVAAGDKAAHLLLSLLGEEPCRETAVLKETLIVRESTVPPAKR